MKKELRIQNNISERFRIMSRIEIKKVGITDAGTEIVVNAANEGLRGGAGVCGAIFDAAGWNELQAECDKIGHCNTGNAVITPACRLNSKYIIHAVGPVWQGGTHDEPKKLYGCYRESLRLAKKHDCHSIAFPLISSGIFGYPKDQAWRKALQAYNDFIYRDEPDYDIHIIFAVIDDRVMKMGQEELEKQKQEHGDKSAHPKAGKDRCEGKV